MKEEILKQSAKLTGKVFIAQVGVWWVICLAPVTAMSPGNPTLMLSSCSRASPQSPIKNGRKFRAFQGQRLLNHNRAPMPWLKDIGNGAWAEIQILPVQNFMDFYPLEESRSSTGIRARLRDWIQKYSCSLIAVMPRDVARQAYLLHFLSGLPRSPKPPL